ncbi:hypothetical protein ADILRU_2345 [Leifsonia rubra CMS 76R]|nr:hypothetical protein ADILRU_2345 [Leifsonia rubra CMS 76R]
MSTATHQVHLPTSTEPGQVLGAYYSLMRALGIELGSRYDDYCSKAIGPDWFAALCKNRAEQKLGPAELFDPSFVLKEPLWHPDSPTRKCLPSGGQFYNLVEDTIHLRNSWAHHAVEPTVESLADAAKLIHELASKANLKVGAAASAMRKRSKGLINGTWSPGAPVEAEPTVPTAPISDDIVNAINAETEAQVEKALSRDAEQPARPSVGGVWDAAVPTQHLRLTKLRRIVDAETSEDLTELLGENASTVIDHWVSLRPMGDLYLDDSDAAVIGYISGSPRLLGYLGPEPTPDPNAIRGFAIPALYRVTATQIIDSSSGQSLHRASLTDTGTLIAGILGRVPAGGTIRVTNYGDVVRIDDTGKAKVAHTSAAQWFPGQLGPMAG